MRRRAARTAGGTPTAASCRAPGTQSPGSPCALHPRTHHKEAIQRSAFKPTPETQAQRSPQGLGSLRPAPPRHCAQASTQPRLELPPATQAQSDQSDFARGRPRGSARSSWGRRARGEWGHIVSSGWGTEPAAVGSIEPAAVGGTEPAGGPLPLPRGRQSARHASNRSGVRARRGGARSHLSRWLRGGCLSGGPQCPPCSHREA